MSQLCLCLPILYPSLVTPIFLPLYFSFPFLSSFSFLIRDPIQMTTEIVQMRFFPVLPTMVWAVVLRNCTWVCLKGLKMPWSLRIFSSHFIINSRQPFICRFMSNAVTSKGGAAYFHPFVLLCAVSGAGMPVTTAETSDLRAQAARQILRSFSGSLILNHEQTYIVS